MMHGNEKSDSVIVAAKPANKAERSAAELVEPRAETKGNAGWQSTLRTQSRACVSQALARMRQALPFGPEVGAVCGKAARTVLCGGRSVMSVPTASLANDRFCAGFSDAGMTMPSTHPGGRRPRSAKARNRGKWGTCGAAGSMGIWPRGQARCGWIEEVDGIALP